MKCRFCKNEIPDGSIFCMFCGEKQIKEKKKKKDEIKVPKPTQLPSGAWRIQLRAEGQSVTEATPELCVTKAKAIRAGFIERQLQIPKITLDAAISNYIASQSSILSPSTLRGYEEIRRNRFKRYINSDISSVDWQKAINEEIAICSPKTLKNSWGLVSKVMKTEGIEVPDINLPQIAKKELPWLNYQQIQTFLLAVHGRSCEFGALLALHSLRLSELLNITPSKISKKGIIVRGSRVVDKNGILVEKQTNKNISSARTVPIMIPRLLELIESSKASNDEYYVKIHPNNLRDGINVTCRQSNLPEVGVHGLRRSFASLAYHLGWSERQTMTIGGWSDWHTMHQIYIKLDESDVSRAAESMTQFYKLLTEFPTNEKTV